MFFVYINSGIDSAIMSASIKMKKNTKSNNIQQIVIFDIIIALCIILRVF